MLAWRAPKSGILEVGFPGNGTILHGAMMLARPEIVVELLTSGACAYDEDSMGNDGLMLACSLGRLNNTKMWLDKHTDWNIDRCNRKFGSTALHYAVYLGHKNIDMVRYLIEERGADVNILNHSGSCALIMACGNEDSDPKVVKYLMRCTDIDVNIQIVSQTLKYTISRAITRFAVRSNMNMSTLMRRVAESGGLTALHYAARRGDMEIVELLLEHGAKPSIKNDLGRDVLS